MKRNWIPKPGEFAAWSRRAEKMLLLGLCILIVLLLTFQTALQIPALRYWLSPTDRLEGNLLFRPSR